MIVLAGAGIAIYIYLRYVQKRTETVVCMVAALAALVNAPAQALLPGGLGIGVSVIVAFGVVAYLTTRGDT